MHRMIVFVVLCSLFANLVFVEGQECPVPENASFCNCLTVHDQVAFEEIVVEYLDMKSDTLIIEFNLNFSSLGSDFDITKRIAEDVYQPNKWFRTRQQYNVHIMLYTMDYLIASSAFLFTKKAFTVHVAETQVGCTANITKEEMECLISNLILQDFCINLRALITPTKDFAKDELVCSQHIRHYNNTNNFAYKCCKYDMHFGITCDYVSSDSLFTAVFWLMSFGIYFLLIHLPGFIPTKKSFDDSKVIPHFWGHDYEDIHLESDNTLGKAALKCDNLKFLSAVLFPLKIDAKLFFCGFVYFHLLSYIGYAVYRHYDLEVFKDFSGTLSRRGLDNSQYDKLKQMVLLLPCGAATLFYIVMSSYLYSKANIDEEEMRTEMKKTYLFPMSLLHKLYLLVSQNSLTMRTHTEQTPNDSLWKRCWKHFCNIVKLIFCMLLGIYNSTLIVSGLLFSVTFLFIIFALLFILCFTLSSPFLSLGCCIITRLLKGYESKHCRYYLGLFSLTLFHLGFSFFLCFSFVFLIQIFIVFLSVHLIQYSELYIIAAIFGILFNYYTQLLRTIRKEHDTYLELALDKISSEINKYTHNGQSSQGNTETTSVSGKDAQNTSAPQGTSSVSGKDAQNTSAPQGTSSVSGKDAQNTSAPQGTSSVSGKDAQNTSAPQGTSSSSGSNCPELPLSSAQVITFQVCIYPDVPAQKFWTEPQQNGGEYITLKKSFFYILKHTVTDQIKKDEIFVCKKFIYHCLMKDSAKAAYRFFSSTLFIVVVALFIQILQKLHHISNWEKVITTVVASIVPMLINALSEKRKLHLENEKEMKKDSREKKFNKRLETYEEKIFIKKKPRNVQEGDAAATSGERAPLLTSRSDYLSINC